MNDPEKIILVIYCLLTTLISGCYFFNNFNDDYDILYSFSVSTLNETDYFVLLPVPITAPAVVNTVSRIIDDLSFETGDGSISMEESDYGLVLNVSASNSIILKAQKRYDSDREDFHKYFNYTFVVLSTAIMNITEQVYFYFQGLENNLISLTFHCYCHSYGDCTIEGDWILDIENVNDGWNNYQIYTHFHEFNPS